MKSLGRIALLIAMCISYAVLSVSAKNRTGVETIETRMLHDINIANNEKLNYTEPTAQERLDTIMKAFQRLPPAELERFGVDITATILDGTPEASNLLKAWSDRQEELKNAMKSMMQPAELMGKLTQQLLSNETLQDEKEQALIDLESLLADIDNSRDFHTIGSWPVLVTQLNSPSNNIKTLAAWAIGTAVKNSYDYQLWVLEPVEISSSENGLKITQVTNALQLLLDNLEDSATTTFSDIQSKIDFQKRLLYAISSAIRGNLDVQGYFLGENESRLEVFNNVLHSMTSSKHTSISVQRKIWFFIEDLLQEVHYIRQELNEELAKLIAAEEGMVPKDDGSNQNISANVEVGMDGEVKASLTPLQVAVESIRSMQLLGDTFIHDDSWLTAAVEVLKVKVVELLSIANTKHSAVVVDEDGVEQVVTVLGGGVDKSHVVAVQEVTRSILLVLTDILKLKTTNISDSIEVVNAAEFKNACIVLVNNRLMATLQDISILSGDEMFEDLIPITQDLMGMMSLCSMSNGSSGSKNM